jgi:DNA-binding CsgD family transcriptional regulator
LTNYVNVCILIYTMKKKDCSGCSAKPICKNLCPDALAYANQDQVSQREKTIGIPVLPAQTPTFLSSGMDITKMERRILTLAKNDFRREEIAERLRITRPTLRKHIERIRRKNSQMLERIS